MKHRRVIYCAYMEYEEDKLPLSISPDRAECVRKSLFALSDAIGIEATMTCLNYIKVESFSPIDLVDFLNKHEGVHP